MCVGVEIQEEGELLRRLELKSETRRRRNNRGLYFYTSRELPPFYVRKKSGYDSLPRGDSRLVCVTSAASYLGLAIVSRLIRRGYSVRALVDSEEELEKLAEEVDDSTDVIGMVVGVMNMESVLPAIEGSAAVFHTSGFVDTAGISGYTKQMARIETIATENVVEACARVSSVRRCVLTSSLLACIWQAGDVFGEDNNNNNNKYKVIDDNSWSDERVCHERKLWFALSKTMMEKAAWKIASGRDVELVTICPALITGLDFHNKTPSSSIAYLKGGSEMYGNGILAAADVDYVAEAQVSVYQMSDVGGRYICFDRIVDRREEIVELEGLLGIHPHRISSTEQDGVLPPLKHLQLTNDKLSRLMTRITGCSPFHMFL